jgi:hypothetical protein
MAIQFGSTQTESVQVPSQSASSIGSGLGGVLGTLAGLAFALPTGGLSAVAAPAMAGAVATAGLGASVGGSIGSSLGGAIGSSSLFNETQTYDVAAAQNQELTLGQALTQMDMPIPPPAPMTAGIGDLELDSTFGAMPSYLEQPPPPFYG